MSSQSIVLLIMGVSGSGKSLIGEKLAEALHCVFIDADQYHSSENKEKMRRAIALTDDDRQPWLERVAFAIDSCMKAKQCVVVACSALKEAYRKILLQDKVAYIFYLQGGRELIAKRLLERKHEFMNATLLDSQFDTLEEPENGFVLDVNKSPDEIVKSALLSLRQYGIACGARKEL